MCLGAWPLCILGDQLNAGAILAFGALASTAILFVAVTIVIRAARAVNSRVMWVIAVTLTVVVLLVSPLCVETLIRLFNRRVDATFVMIDPGWTIKILPGV